MPAPTKVGSSKIVHPLYSVWQPTWVVAHDVYEGAGGFLDEARPYLVPHPREWLDHSIKDAATGAMSPNPNPTKPSPKLLMRRKLARYENVSATILDSLFAALFGQKPSRTFSTENPQIIDWWKNVDGKRSSIDDFMRDSEIVAAVFGSAILLAEKADEQAETQADVKMPVIRRYTPLDLIDWLIDEHGELISVKLLELAPRKDFSRPQTQKDIRVRVVDDTTWTVYDNAGNIAKDDAGKPMTGEHGFGRLPVELLFGKRRPLTPVVGKSIMGDPQLYIDLYNLTSEVRELLRNQTFAILNVPIGPDGSVEKERENIGKQSGTNNVLFSSQAAAYLSPQADNVRAYHEHMDRLARTIYRLASVPWEGDSRDAQSADALKLKRQDQQNTVKKYSAEMQRADLGILELVYRALYGEDGFEKQMASDGVTVAYPTEFEVPDLAVVAETAAAFLGLELGETATKEFKKGAARAGLPALSTEQMKKVDGEIDAMKVLSADEKRQQMLSDTQAKFAWHLQDKGIGTSVSSPKPGGGAPAVN